MTNEEILCEFMEKRPKLPKRNSQIAAKCGEFQALKWWIWRPMTSPFFFPVPLTLDLLREIEERLTEQQIGEYDCWLRKLIREDPKEPWVPARCHEWHASAEQKIKALAEVLK